LTKGTGLFGGTFDPIHNGHLRLAESALKECRLERVVFLPAAYPPHKPVSHLTPFLHRAEMIRLALQGKRMYTCSLIEGALQAPTYTIDTLRYLCGRFAGGTELFFLTGLDAFLEIRTWKSYEELLKTVSFVVSERTGDFAEVKEKLARELGYTRKGRLWQSVDEKKPVIFLDRPPIDVSSSDIRRKIRAGDCVDGLVPDNVLTYIRNHRLYSDNGQPTGQ
jgi:nicotinate-nucleotide adenylyltransferase